MKPSETLINARAGVRVSSPSPGVTVLQGPWHERSVLDGLEAQPGPESHEDDDLNPGLDHETQVRLRGLIDWSRAPAGTSAYIALARRGEGGDHEKFTDVAAAWVIGEDGENRVRAVPYFNPHNHGVQAFLARRPGRAWEHAAAEKARSWLRNAAAQFPREMLLSLPAYTGYNRATPPRHPLSVAISAAMQH